MFPKLKHQLSLSKGLLLVLLCLLLLLGTAPGYISGQFAWTNPPKVKNLSQLKSLRKNGLVIPGWQTLSHTTDTIGGHEWSVQELKLTDTPENTAILLLFPQGGPKSQPEVQWMDLNGYKDWNTDQERPVTLTVDNATIQARFFRGWTEQQSYAVLQWYAWSNGGNPSPSQWFWSDQQAQWQGRRLGWVAVSILVPIEPLGEITKVQPLIQSLGTAVQKSLQSGPLQ